MRYYDSDPRTRRFAGPDVAAIDAGLRAHIINLFLMLLQLFGQRRDQ